MASVIMVFSASGGMGKSFFSSNISYGLKTFGKRVLLAELGFGNRADDIILGIKTETIYSFSDICSGSCKTHEAITKSQENNIPDFISSGLPVNNTDYKLAVSAIINSQSSSYDYIILDVSQAFGNLFYAALEVADTVIAVTDDSAISVRNTALAMAKVRDMGLKNSYIVLNNVVVNNDESACCAEDIADETGEKILGIIPSDEHVKSSLGCSEPIYKYNTYAGRALENICKRIMGTCVPDYETGVSGGFFSKNKLVIK